MFDGLLIFADSLFYCLSVQDREQMSAGIYSTKWFLQCFIDRVRNQNANRSWLNVGEVLIYKSLHGGYKNSFFSFF